MVDSTSSQGADFVVVVFFRIVSLGLILGKVPETKKNLDVWQNTLYITYIYMISYIFKCSSNDDGFFVMLYVFVGISNNRLFSYISK